MSQSITGFKKTFSAAADYSAKQHYIVYLSAANTVTLASAATQFLVGVLANEPKAGEAAEVSLISGGGTFKVKLGGTVSAVGAALTADSAGKAVATTTTGDYIIGRALETGVANDIIEVLPVGHIRYAATA